MSHHIDVLLIGAGPMAMEYHKVLSSLDINFEVVCRSEESAKKVTEAWGVNATAGGLGKWIEKGVDAPKFAIVATPVESLYPITLELLEFGVLNILVEKPGFLLKNEGEKLSKFAKSKNANVLVAYNRRFFSSVYKAKEIIQQDGGVSSFNFEFTEWAHVIEPLQKGEGVKERWFLGNSTHVVDLAFYLGGIPKEISCYTEGSLQWHPSASKFSGSGVSQQNALFSYFADWEAPGRWVVEIMTHQHRLIFKPMEQLHFQKKGSVAVELVDVNNELDIKFKPGLYKMTTHFLEENFNNFCTLKEQVDKFDIYCKMANYND